MAVGAARMGDHRLDPFPCFQTGHLLTLPGGKCILGTLAFCVDHHRQRRYRGRHERNGNQRILFMTGLPHTKSMNLLNGISRMRLPVAANMALASAGAAGGTGGSPMPLTV